MMFEREKNMYDVTFIGSGISSSFTILHFLNGLERTKESEVINIKIIDRYKEFHTGIPYGTRSGFSVHLITSLKNFLPEPQRSEFITWLNINKNWLLENLKKEGGALSIDWITTHADKIANNDWDDLFIPRSFFGKYINEKVENKVKTLQEKGLVKVDYLQNEVIDVNKNDNRYTITLADGNQLVSTKVILSVGSLPVNHLWKKQSLVRKEQLLFINNPYKPSLKDVLEEIETYSKNRSDKKLNVLIVGANASGLEMSYKLNDVSEIRDRIDTVVFLSTQGLLPDAVVDQEGKSKFVPFHLQELINATSLTAKQIADATYKDLDYADKINLGAASTVEIISSAFGGLLSKLSVDELKKFTCVYGNEIGRRQRCAGYHYSKTIDQLKKEGRFVHIAGRFSTMILENDKTYKLEYLDTQSSQNKIYEDPIDIVINCVGSTKLTSPEIPQMLSNLIKKGYCTPNESQIGFEVNEDMEASENLHIIGPLLAGNVFEGRAVWHVEHCGRIIWLSGLLANTMNNFFAKEVNLKK